MAKVEQAIPRIYSPDVVGNPTDGFRNPDLTLEARVDRLNRAYAAYDNVVGSAFRAILEAQDSDRNGILERLKPAVRNEVAHLLNAYEQMNSHAQHVKEALSNGLSTWSSYIEQAYKTADGLTHNKSKESIAAARIATLGGKFLAVSDFDNSVTEGDSHVRQMPTAQLEHLLQQYGRDRFTELSLTTAHRMMQRDKRAMRDVGRKHVVFREGFGKFIQYTQEIKAPRPVILSANYEDILYGALENKPQAHGNVEILSITPESDLSRHKDLILKYLAANNYENAVFFIGDGSSDAPAIDARQNVAFYFALKDSSFERMCEKAGVVYFEYQDFNDIRLKLQEIMSQVPEFQRQLSQDV